MQKRNSQRAWVPSGILCWKSGFIKVRSATMWSLRTGFFKTAGECFANHCDHCGVIQGNWYLFEEDSPLTAYIPDGEPKREESVDWLLTVVFGAPNLLDPLFCIVCTAIIAAIVPRPCPRGSPVISRAQSNFTDEIVCFSGGLSNTDYQQTPRNYQGIWRHRCQRWKNQFQKQ